MICFVIASIFAFLGLISFVAATPADDPHTVVYALDAAGATFALSVWAFFLVPTPAHPRWHRALK
jgi:hypothetical protein